MYMCNIQYIHLLPQTDNWFMIVYVCTCVTYSVSVPFLKQTMVHDCGCMPGCLYKLILLTKYCSYKDSHPNKNIFCQTRLFSRVDRNSCFIDWEISLYCTAHPHWEGRETLPVWRGYKVDSGTSFFLSSIVAHLCTAEERGGLLFVMVLTRAALEQVQWLILAVGTVSLLLATLFTPLATSRGRLLIK